MSRGVLAAILLLVMAIAVVAADLYLARGNTLRRNGRWAVTKVGLERRPMGAVAFFATRTTLARNQLNLDRYFSYNEVVHRQTLKLRRLTFAARVQNGPGCLLAVGFQRGPAGSSGLMLCDGEGARQSFFYDADSVGMFRRRTPVKHGPIFGRGWVQVALTFEAGKVSAAINGAPAGAHQPPFAASQVISFRTSGFILDEEEEVLVDDVAFHLRDGSVLREAFDNRRTLLHTAAAAALGVALLNLLLVLALRGRRGAGTPALLLNATALIGVLALYVVDHRHFSHQVPDPDQIDY